MGEPRLDKPLQGETICITGGFCCYLRKDLAGIIRSLGGEFTEEFSSRTTLLLQGHTVDDAAPTAKLRRAREQGVPVETEREFCERYGLRFQPSLGF